MSPDTPPRVAAGTTIGRYGIVGWLGAGGMGVVYRATDARLSRDVAIKVLPQGLATDATRIGRFEQEARAAGQLNHPNVLAVYDVGIHDGAPYIVAELLEGDSLRAHLQRGKIAPRKAIDYAKQIAAGLASAHDKGIIHRDIKPDNLFVTSDGRIKILDFGIAKLNQAGDDTRHGATETAPGMVVGTTDYMSPEQCRGEAVDARSDLFSVGTVLHEMLTGRPAFKRDSVAETITAILTEEPQEPLPAGTPPALERIVTRCLEKARDTRYQSARDLAFSLEVLSDSTATRELARKTTSWRSIAWIAAAALGLAAVIGAAAWLTRGRLSQPVDPFANAQFSRFTDWPGIETGAAISPDGKFVAFLADRDGKLDLFVSQVGTGRFVNLTPDLPPRRLPGLILRDFGFTGDGSEIAFGLSGRGALIPISGGSTRPLLGPGDALPSWSPDDRRLVYFNNKDGDPIYIADRSGRDAQPISVNAEGFFAKGIHNHNPIWSPDGAWIYFAHGPDPAEEMNVWRVRPSGGAAEQLTTLHAAANVIAPLDARTVLYIARADDGSGPWLWSLDVETRTTKRVVSGLEYFSSVSASRDGRRVVVTSVKPIVSLWRLPLLDRQIEETDVQPYPTTTARALSPRFVRAASGGDALFFLSARGAGDGLWLWKGGRSSEIWTPTGDAITEPPAVAPDGHRVAIVVRQSGKSRLVVMSEDGTNSQTLAPSLEIQTSAGSGSLDWSPDGAWLVATGSDASGPGLFKIPTNGGPLVRLVSGLSFNPVWSPADGLIVYGGPVVGGELPLLGVTPEGTPVKLPDALPARLGAGHRFLPSGKGLIYLPRSQPLDFFFMDFVTGTTRPLTHLGSRGSLRAFDVTPDGTSIVFDRTQQTSDIYLIERQAP